MRNLDDDAIDIITVKINSHWRSGTVPPEWKDAKVTFIPKPGKPLTKENLRPISLTSCIGKVAEHAIHNRIIEHIENQELFRHNLIGFRKALSTQDAMLMIKRAIIDDPSRDVKGLLGLDLIKAFDTVAHKHILHEISTLNLGSNFYNYVRSFLANRTARVKLGIVTGGPYNLGNNGTPQGSVLSPLLFNIAMHRLSEELSKIPSLGHVIYADDITVWVPRGSLAALEQTLQAAVDTTESFLKGTGLRLSPSKSELLLFRQGRQGVRNLAPLETLPIKITDNTGRVIPRVEKIKILGLLIDARSCNATALNRLTGQANSTLKLLGRVSNRNAGLKEDNLIRAYHAFFISHVTYIASYLNWGKGEKAKLNALIRSGLKRALGLPHGTSTELLNKLGLHNTIDELIEAHSMSQIARLSNTKPGCKILDEVGILPRGGDVSKFKIPKEVETQLVVDPYQEIFILSTTRAEGTPGPNAFWVNCTNNTAQLFLSMQLVMDRATATLLPWSMRAVN